MFKGYKMIKEEAIPALDGIGYWMTHEHSGARIFVIKNEDDNRVFNISFRTPPNDDTGLPHILEHSVLCGSRKYPVKDPFVELAKGSLNTFLNAMTYSDKTMYPVASCNLKDFHNLMDVYLDAVFYPNIYKDERILKQEGWHYELGEEGGEILYNGVVFNEMKGASSSPEQVLFRQIQQVLFPDHPYGYDSGGDPEAIVDLSYDHFLDFHRTYYHPSNSYIFLYGDLDVAEELALLDQSYLKDFPAIEMDSSLTIVPAFEAPVAVEKPYAIASDMATEKKTYLSYNLALKKAETPCETLGLEILEYLLLEAPGAPLKEALLKLGIAEDIFGSYDSGLNQPTFSIVAKNSDSEHEGIFVETIETTLRKIAEQGLPKKKIEAAINYFEFKTREADYGQYPKGVIYAIRAMDTWLYDGDPFINFDYDGAFNALREGLDSGCIYDLIKKYLLGNNHKALLQLIPDQTLLEKKEAVMKAKIQAYAETLSQEDRKALVKETADLKAYQEAPSSPEALETVPLLQLSDIDEKGREISYETRQVDGVTYILHASFTGNIIYGKVSLDMTQLSFDQLPYANILVKVLTKLDTLEHSYSELTDEINLNTGGFKWSVPVYGVNADPYVCTPKFEVKFKCFADKLDTTLALISEVLTNTSFEDEDRMRDLLLENKSRMSMSLMSSGHNAAMTRAMSYHSIVGLYKERLEGISYYNFLEDILQAPITETARILKDLLKSLVQQGNAHVLINTTEDTLEPAFDTIHEFMTSLPKDEAHEDVEEAIAFDVKNEGFKTASKVQYCALTSDFIAEGYEYTGAMKVLQTIMSLDYMWTEVRVKGGAYGGFGGFRRSGLFYLSSYRDPNLKKTYEIYQGLPSYVAELDFSEREMTKYIIGTISSLDTPLTPQMAGDKAFNMYMSGVDYELELKERSQVLGAGIEELRALSPMLERLIAQNNICVLGNESKIEEEKEILGEVVTLNL